MTEKDAGRAQHVEVAGRLVARPHRPAEPGSLGLRPLGLAEGRDGLIYVPSSHGVAPVSPLVVLLHGARGDGRTMLQPLQPLADEAGLLLLAPDARRQTWDVILGGYGPDVRFLDQALAWAFDHYAVDATRLAVGGFSDGASYALSLGLMNGDLFSHVIAFSPGFTAPTELEGMPRFFVSHGTHDGTLPIDSCSRRIVPQLRRAGYDVHYREFDGGHTIPPKIAREAVDWFAAAEAFRESDLRRPS